jgi:type VI secretion system secreted protein Hcp
MPTVEVKWFRTSMEGKQEHDFTTKLTDALIVDIQADMPNCQDPGRAHFTHLEKVSFASRALDWTHEVAGTSGSDDWRAQSLEPETLPPEIAPETTPREDAPS